MKNVKCLNPWDPQSKRQYRIDGVYATLHARQNGGGQADGICYAIEGNVVDRISSKNGKGWCEDVSPTLNTQDRHAVVYALEGNGARPSHLGKGWSDDGTMYTLNTIEQHSVCYGISRSCLKGGNGSNGGMPICENLQPSMTANGCGAVCYDARGNGDGKISPTVTGDHNNRITDYTTVVVQNNDGSIHGRKRSAGSDPVADNIENTGLYARSKDHSD